MQQAVDALVRHCRAIDGMYGESAEFRVVASTKAVDALVDVPQKPLPVAIDLAMAAVFGG